MKLQMFSRIAERKSEAKKTRRMGQIPAIIYAEKKPSEPISISNIDFETALRSVQSGHLPTTVFTLVEEEGKQRQVVIKEIQYHPTTYAVLHLDFEELHDNVPLKVKVPIECTGVVDCVGIKLGGTLRQIIRYLRVRCLPRDLPKVFTLDIRNMGVGEAKRLADLAIPENVQPLAALNEVAIVIAKG